MKAFYDAIIPNWVNKFGKKYGVKVGETDFRDADISIDERIKKQAQTVKTIRADLAGLENKFNQLEGVHVSITNDRVQYDYVKPHYNSDGVFDRNLNVIEVENVKSDRLDGEAKRLSREIESALRLAKSAETELNNLKSNRSQRIGVFPCFEITQQLREVAKGGLQF